MAWLAGYNNRRQIAIAGTTAGAQTNYQMKARLWYNYINRYIGTSTNSWGGTGASYTRNGFYANGRWWHFYATGSNIAFRSSIDGITWSAATDFYAQINGAFTFSVVVDASNYVHIVYDDTGGDNLFYRRGLCNADGTITFDAQQTVWAQVTNYDVVDPHIALDSNGYPWIAYGKFKTSTNPYSEAYGFVQKSSTKDGTWTTEFTQQINTASFGYLQEYPQVWCMLTQLSNGKMYAIAEGYAGNVTGRLYNSGWGAEETIAACVGEGGSIVSIGDDVYFSYLPLLYKRTYGVGWGAPINCGVNITSLSVDGSDIYALYVKAGSSTYSTVCYKKFSGGAFGSEVILIDDLANGIGKANFYDKIYNGKLIYHYTGGSASPYSIVWGSLVENPANISLNGKAQSDFDDVRFTTSNGTTLLDYWIEAKVNYGYADIWVEFDSVPASPSGANFYAYYNNPSAIAGSNGDGTFLFFDDFPGVALDGTKWTLENSPTVSVAGSIVTVSGVTADAWRGIHSNNTYGAYLRWRSKMKIGASVGGIVKGLQSVINGWSGDMTAFAKGSAASGYIRTANNGVYTTTDFAGIDPLNYHIYDMLWKSGEVKFYEDTILKITHNTNIPDQALYNYMCIYYIADITYADWIFLSKYVSPEPTFSAWGAEEAAGGNLFFLHG